MLGNLIKIKNNVTYPSSIPEFFFIFYFIFTFFFIVAKLILKNIYPSLDWPGSSHINYPVYENLLSSNCLEYFLFSPFSFDPLTNDNNYNPFCIFIFYWIKIKCLNKIERQKKIMKGCIYRGEVKKKKKKSQDEITYWI